MVLKSCTSRPETLYYHSFKSSDPEILYNCSRNLVQLPFQLKCSWNLVQVVPKSFTTSFSTEVFLKSCTSGPETFYSHSFKSSVYEILYKWSRNLNCTTSLSTQVFLKSCTSGIETLYNLSFKSIVPKILYKWYWNLVQLPFQLKCSWFPQKQKC